MNKNQQSKITLIAIIIILSFLSCAEELTAPSHTNPFDPNNPETDGIAIHLMAILANSGITLQWTHPDFDNLRSFRIYRSEQEQSGYKIIVQVTSSVFHFTDTNIENGNSYWYKITAVNRSNTESSISYAVPANIKT